MEVAGRLRTPPMSRRAYVAFTALGWLALVTFAGCVVVAIAFWSGLSWPWRIAICGAAVLLTPALQDVRRLTWTYERYRRELGPAEEGP